MTKAGKSKEDIEANKYELLRMLLSNEKPELKYDRETVRRFMRSAKGGVSPRKKG